MKDEFVDLEVKRVSSETPNPLISIVIPVFNEQQILPDLINRLIPVLDNLGNGYRFEVFFIDDGSSDHTYEMLQDFSKKDHRLKIIAFSRNFGHQAAIVAGLDHSNGEAVITIDGDLQDPPELIPQMLAEWVLGYRMVYCRRVARPGETWVKILTANIYYRLIRWLADVDLPRNVGDFRLMDKEFVTAVRFSDEKSLYLRGLTSWVGYASSEILYERSERTKGETKYTLKKMIGLGSDGIISFSDKPLRLVARMGVLVTGLGFFLGLYFLLSLFTLGSDATPGWLSTILIVLSLSGVQLLSLGVVGLYISRIYREVKGRQTYVIDLKKSKNI